MLSVNNYLMTFYYFLMFERATSSAVRQRNNPHPRCSIWMMRVSYITGIMLFLSLKLNSRECVCVHVCVCLHVCGCALSHNHAQSCLTLCDPMNHSTPGLPVHHQLPEFTQTHVHRVGDAIQPSHPLSSPSPPAPTPSQHQGLFQRANSLHEVAKKAPSLVAQW